MPVVGLLLIELHFPEAHSLKDKRALLRSIKDRLRKLNVTVAEVGHQELWQRTSLAVAVVGSEQLEVDRSLGTAFKEVERKGNVIVLNTEVQWLT